MEPSTATEDIFIKADEVDEPPPAPEEYPVSKQHAFPETEAPPPPNPPAHQEKEVEKIQDGSLFHDLLGLKTSTSKRPLLKKDTSNPGQMSERERLAASSASFRASSENYFRSLRHEREREANQQEHMQEDSEPEQPQDSLSLSQLKKLLQEMPKAEPTPYAFEYADTSSFEEELEELFDYSVQERETLVNAQTSFIRRWETFRTSKTGSNAHESVAQGWQDSEDASKIGFFHLLKSELQGNDAQARISALDCALYLALGCWLETALVTKKQQIAEDDHASDNPFSQTKTQVAAMEANVDLMSEQLGIEVIFDILRQTYSDEDDLISTDTTEVSPKTHQRLQERWASLVLLYLMIDIGRRKAREKSDTKLRNNMLSLKPNILHVLTRLLVKSRFEDAEDVTFSRLLLLFWKAILLFFGGTAEIKTIKDLFSSSNGITQSITGPTITASPLDYHMFRQEIISKYPAFDPPNPLFPFEPDNNSILPPLQEHPTRSNTVATTGSEAGPANIQSTGISIMQQPIHIATPAPSPPPSPAGPGGKGIKKQNYQTNQMFPFMYPPLDHTSNDLGGKGSTEIQDLFAGRKWEGSSIPASILEAADLFSKRMRATRAMRQLWAERIRFLKFERGSHPDDPSRVNEEESNEGDSAVKDDPDLLLLSDDFRERLLAVDDFYENALPQLQSLVLVLLKVLLMAVTTLITQPYGAEGLRDEETHDYNGEPKGSMPAQMNGNTAEGEDPALSDLSTLREQEIMGKAVSGILLLLLKWFKLSHILKFEYFSQLLLDSNYIQFILKLFTHQALERAVTYKCERTDLNFFTLCRTFAERTKPTIGNEQDEMPEVNEDLSAGPEAETENDSDDAAPPPIKFTRQQPVVPPPTSALAYPSTFNRPRSDSSSPPQVRSNALQGPDRPVIPEVDELGYPVSQLPPSPITNYSWRTFFTSINHLRILQKLVKAKPHRQLLMVQSKYSLTLKKHLKVPQHDIRLYTLKIIKGQVPYCHRKWRSSNMRIITAIYLHVKPGLRDEWLSGLDVEQEVGEALPLEQALRALTFWWHLRMYPDDFGGATDVIEDTPDAATETELELELDLSTKEMEVPGIDRDGIPSPGSSRLYIQPDLGIDIRGGSNGHPGTIVPPPRLPSPDHRHPTRDIDQHDLDALMESIIAEPLPESLLRGQARDLSTFLLPTTSSSTTHSSFRRHSTAQKSNRKRSILDSNDDDFFLRELEKMDLGPPTSSSFSDDNQSVASNGREEDRRRRKDANLSRFRELHETGVGGFYGDGSVDEMMVMDLGGDDAPALEGTLDEDGNVVISRVEPDEEGEF